MGDKAKTALFVIMSLAGTLLLSQMEFAKNVDLFAFDVMLRHVPANEPVKESRVAVIGIDDASLAKEDTPMILWVGYFAKTVDLLSEAGAAAVVFDVIPYVSLEKISPKLDEVFMKSMMSARNRGTQVFLGFNNGASDYMMPSTKFLFSASGVGFVNLKVDQDGRIRRQTFWENDRDDNLVPSLSLAAAAAHEGIEYSDKEAVCARLGACENGRPKPLLIDYRISHEKIKLHSISEVMSRGGDLKPDFAGKVVFVGPFSEKFRDDWRVPLDPRRPGDAKPYMSGLFIHVQNALTLLSHEKFRSAPLWSTIAFTAVFALLSMALMLKYPPLGTSVALSSLAAAAIVISAAAFSQYYFLPVSPVVYGILVPSGMTRSFLYMRQYKQSKVLKKYFGSYVSPEVMKDIIKNPDKVNFDGILMDMTIVFTDIRNFTTLSERLSPPEVTRGLNRYFTAMTKCITETGGYVNRYLGDGILALYGAPTPLPNRGALEAIKGALEMLKELELLNQREMAKQAAAPPPGPGEEPMRRRLYPIRIGVGIHTGSVIVGNIGCFEKMDYTVIGDAANLASRVEGLTKNYGVPVLISEETYLIVKDSVEAKFIDRVKVKGRENETAVYAVTGLKEEKI